MKFLSTALLGVFILAAAHAEFKFERDEYTSPLKIGARPRVTPHTMIFARIQPYNLSGNYLDTWIDRPLYHNSAWRDEATSGYRNAPEARRDAESVGGYEIDGFTMLGSAYDSCYRAMLGFLKESEVKNFQFMPGLGWGAAVPYKKYRDNAAEAFKSPYTTRINGKVPFFSYGTMPEKNIREIREKLAADGYSDIALFDNIWLDVFSKYNRQNQTLTDKDLAECESRIREKLNYLDGLIFVSYHMDRNPKGDYTLSRRFYPELTEKYFAPLFEKIYREPANKNKLLGLNIRHGYLGHMSGTNEGEFGTSQLREALDIALLLNPDILSLVEWNEANENTSFQPNLYNSKSLQRLIRFYARRLKDLPPAPNPGDDLTMPNLVVSTRQTVRLGERYRIELLNIPDSAAKSSYTVQLTLINQDGKEIHRFEPDQFQANQLTAITYRVPSELMAEHLAVIPVLNINYQGHNTKIDTLQYTRLDATVAWNFKEVRQSIRDLLIPQATELKVEGGRISAALDAGTPLASLELLDNEEEIYAFDRLNKFDRGKYHTVLLKCQAKKDGLRKVRLTVPGVPAFQFFPWGRPYAGFGKLQQNGDTLDGDFLLWHGGGSILLNIPKDAPDAEIKFNIDGIGEASVRMTDLLKQREYGVELPELVQVYFTLREKLADHPLHIDRNQAKFAVDLQSEYPLPCYQLRAVTKDGRIFRSRPVFPKQPGTRTELLNVFSATDGKMATVQLPADRIEDTVYIFDPAAGIFLKNSASPKWNAVLGGGFRYLHPMRYVKLPDKIGNTAPVWVKDEEANRWLLRFDGVGNYLILPMEAFPTGSFTLEFECRTASTENQMLFRHGALRQNSLDTYIVDGKLQASFAGMGYNFTGIVRDFPVNLDFPSNRWNHVKISYDLKNLRFEVNGQMRSFPFTLRAAKPAAAVFGGEYGQDTNKSKHGLNYFNGELRSLRISRNAANLE